MKKTYCVLGGGGSFGLHTSKYLLDHADPAKVIAVGRNLPKYECFTLGIGDGDPRYSYHAYHETWPKISDIAARFAGDPYALGEVAVYPLIAAPDSFDTQLMRWARLVSWAALC